MNLLAGVGNGLFFLPAVGKRAALSVKYTPGLLGWVVQGTSHAWPGRPIRRAGVYRGSISARNDWP